MPVKVRDVLKINVVFVGINLLNNPAEIREFSEAVNADVTVAVPGMPLEIPPDGYTPPIGELQKLKGWLGRRDAAGYPVG